MCLDSDLIEADLLEVSSDSDFPSCETSTVFPLKKGGPVFCSEGRGLVPTSTECL